MLENNTDGIWDHHPRVSIIIPNYNYSKFIEERFHSILNQSFRDYEIIFLDDASTDDSVEYVKSRFGQYIYHIEVNTTNSGNPFVQWNKGVRLAKGEFVWIAEADDTCTSDFLEKMVNVMSSNPTVGLAYCHTKPINDVGAVLDDEFFLRYVSDLDSDRWRHNFIASGTNELKNFLTQKNTITNVSGVLFRRDSFIQAGYASENMRMCGDWMSYCKILQVSDVAYHAQPMNFHRQHPTKHTQNSVLNLTYFVEYLQVQQYIAEIVSQNAHQKKLALRRFLREWDRLTVSNYGRIDLGRTLALARMAATAYPDVEYQLEIIIHLILNALKSLAAKWIEN